MSWLLNQDLFSRILAVSATARSMAGRCLGYTAQNFVFPVMAGRGVFSIFERSTPDRLLIRLPWVASAAMIPIQPRIRFILPYTVLALVCADWGLGYRAAECQEWQPAMLFVIPAILTMRHRRIFCDFAIREEFPVTFWLTLSGRGTISRLRLCCHHVAI